MGLGSAQREGVFVSEFVSLSKRYFLQTTDDAAQRNSRSTGVPVLEHVDRQLQVPNTSGAFRRRLQSTLRSPFNACAGRWLVAPHILEELKQYQALLTPVAPCVDYVSIAPYTTRFDEAHMVPCGGTLRVCIARSVGCSGIRTYIQVSSAVFLPT